jgi:hypothetical protein
MAGFVKCNSGIQWMAILVFKHFFITAQLFRSEVIIEVSGGHYVRTRCKAPYQASCDIEPTAGKSATSSTQRHGVELVET